jgi:hypothetical protein
LRMKSMNSNYCKNKCAFGEGLSKGACQHVEIYWGVLCVALRSIFYTLAFSWFCTEWYSLIHGPTFEEYSLVSMSQMSYSWPNYSSVRMRVTTLLRWFACHHLPQAPQQNRSRHPRVLFSYKRSLSLFLTLFLNHHTHMSSSDP